MNAITHRSAIATRVLALTTSVAAMLSSCTQTQPPLNSAKASNSDSVSTVKIDGSSTVYPMTKAVAENFQSSKAGKNAQVKVDFSGTTAGFEKFCAGEIDIGDASRPILTTEMEACDKNGVRYIELPIAFDALTVAVHPQNTWAKDITVEELKKIWSPAAQGKISRWNQIRSSWPNRPIQLYGADKQSGTFDYFTEAVVGKAKASRNDYTASEDDDVLVAGVSKDSNALGYFGFAYYEANPNKLKALAVDNGKGAVLPSRQSVENAQYQPLSRPLFIYVNAKAAQDNEAVKNFVDFYIKQAPQTVSSVGYVPLPKEAYDFDNVHFYTGKVGTVFDGQAHIDLTMSELLRKEAKF